MHYLNDEILGKFGRNQMSYDLGFDVGNFDNLDMIGEFIKAIDINFHLVMIADRMDESLILLRHLLCWTFNDVIVFRHNARSRSGSHDLSKDLKQNIRLFNIADSLLYNHFSDKLNHLTTTFGEEKMRQEINILQNATKLMYHKCVSNAVSNSMIVLYRKNQTMNKNCQDFVISELAFTDLLRQKQRTRNNLSKIHVNKIKTNVKL